MRRSPEFCSLLIEAYPGSERMPNVKGDLPLHYGTLNSVATVEYLCRLDPNTINCAVGGSYPIHYAILNVKRKDNPAATVEIVKFLLNYDPNQKLKRFHGMSLLQYACLQGYNDSNIEAGIQIVELLFDAHPEMIEEDRFASGIQGHHQHLQTFINRELVYARQARDRRLMTTPDDNGQLPLHTALQNNVRLGSIKLLVKGNPAAVQSAENSGALPLHVACMHHDSVSVIQYLAELDPSTLDAIDREGNTTLHLACQGARHDITALLLDEFDAVSVSKRNAVKKLPIDLLWESDAVDRESIEYTESVYRLLRANPEMMVGIDVQMMQSPASTSPTLPCQTRKKRKLGL